MRTLIIGNQSVRQVKERVLRVWKTGKAEPAARLDFVSLDDAWKPLSTKRRAIMHAMAAAGPLSIREFARRVGRDVRAVHSDVQLRPQCRRLRRRRAPRYRSLDRLAGDRPATGGRRPAPGRGR
jgi:hypothetical protein